MPSCSIKWCGKSSGTSNFTKDNITFHRFPRDVETKSLWIKATKRKNWYPATHSVICSRHFTADCLLSIKGNRRKVLEGSVPTLFIPNLMNIPDEAPPLAPCLLKKEENITRATVPLSSSSTSEVANFPPQNLPKLTPKPKPVSSPSLRFIKQENTSTQETELNSSNIVSTGAVPTQNLPSLIRIPKPHAQTIPCSVNNGDTVTLVTEFASPSCKVGAFSMVYLPNLVRMPNQFSQPILCSIKQEDCSSQKTESLETSTSAAAGNVPTQNVPKMMTEVALKPMEEDTSSPHRQTSSFNNSDKNDDEPIITGVTTENVHTFSDPYEKRRLCRHINDLNCKLMKKNKKIKCLHGQIRYFQKKLDRLSTILCDLDNESLLSEDQKVTLKRLGLLK